MEGKPVPGRKGAASQMLVADAGIAVVLDGGARLRVAGAMLNAAIESNSANSADRKLIESLATRCIDDLCGRLSAAAGLPPTTQWHVRDDAELPFAEARRCTIQGASGEALATIVLGADLAVHFARQAAPAAPAYAPLGPVLDGLARQEVTVSALLGRCEVTLTELAALRAGDVLVLDRDLGSPAALAIEGAVKGGQATVSQQDGKLSLTIVQPLPGRPK